MAAGRCCNHRLAATQLRRLQGAAWSKMRDAQPTRCRPSWLANGSSHCPFRLTPRRLKNASGPESHSLMVTGCGMGISIPAATGASTSVSLGRRHQRIVSRGSCLTAAFLMGSYSTISAASRSAFARITSNPSRNERMFCAAPGCQPETPRRRTVCVVTSSPPKTPTRELVGEDASVVERNVAGAASESNLRRYTVKRTLFAIEGGRLPRTAVRPSYPILGGFLALLPRASNLHTERFEAFAFLPQPTSAHSDRPSVWGGALSWRDAHIREMVACLRDSTGRAHIGQTPRSTHGADACEVGGLLASSSAYQRKRHTVAVDEESECGLFMPRLNISGSTSN